nr:CPPV177 N1R/p28-like protein [Cooks petrelpox virus]
MDLSVTVTDHIDDRFSWVRYDDFEIIIMKENGYVNATKLCILGNKRLRDWLNMETTKELIREAEYLNRNWKVKSFYTDIKGVVLDIESEEHVYEVSGCYIHQDLVSHVTSWISPLFSLKVSKIMNYYIMSKYERELKEKEDINKEFLKLLKDLYKKHDKDIGKLKERYKEQRKNIKCLETKYDNEIEELKLRNVNTICKHKKELVVCTSSQSDTSTNNSLREYDENINTQDTGICNSEDLTSEFVDSIQYLDKGSTRSELLASSPNAKQDLQKTDTECKETPHNSTCKIVQSSIDSEDTEKNNTLSIADKLRRFRFEGSRRTTKCPATPDRVSKYFSQDTS